MPTQTTAKYQTDQDLISGTSGWITPFSTEEYNLSILGGRIEGEVLEFEKIFHFELFQPKKKLKGWGLFKGLKIEESEIEEAKKSLFPEREF